MCSLVIVIALVGTLYFYIQDKKEEKAQKEQK
jgi:preprotein translocase subunit YajC